MMTLVTGIIGIALLIAYEGTLLWWIKAPPLIIIVTVVVAIVIYDFVQAVRSGEDEAGS